LATFTRIVSDDDRRDFCFLKSWWHSLPAHRQSSSPICFGQITAQAIIWSDRPSIPVGPPAPTGLHRGTPWSHFIRPPRAFAWLCCLGSSVQPTHFPYDFMSWIFGLSEARASQIKALFPRPHEDSCCSFPSDSLSKTFRWIGKLMMRGSCASRNQNYLDRAADLPWNVTWFGFSHGFLGLLSSPESGIFQKFRKVQKSPMKI
jgi:hypothetical protein